MPNNEVMIETVPATEEVVMEVGKAASDKTGIIFVGVGVALGVGLTVGVVKGGKALKNKIQAKKAAKSEKKVVVAEEE